MSDEAPSRLDRAVLRCVSGTLGHLVGTVIEVVHVLRVRRAQRRATPR